jgi:hypothetical protein
MKIVIGLLVGLLVGCAGGGGGGGPAPDSSHPVRDESTTQEGSIKICHVAKAREAIGTCLGSWSDRRQSALLATISAWAFQKDYFYPSDLDRDSFKQRYQLNDEDVSCLDGRTCGVENENAL